MTNWNRLTLRQKSQLMKIYIKHNILDLEKIKSHYNMYGGGGEMKSYPRLTPSHINFTPQELQFIYNVNGDPAAPNFIKRALTFNQAHISDWENPSFIATHKLGYDRVNIDGKDQFVIYPSVQEVNGKLVDFTKPPYSKGAAWDNAFKNHDFIIAPNEEFAEKFTKGYKQLYKGFPENQVFDEIDRNTFNNRGERGDFIYKEAINNGYSAEQAAAIVGSLFVEGQLNENAKEKGHTKKGIGIAQWTDPTRIKNLNNYQSLVTRDEFNRQVEFLFKELKDQSVWKNSTKSLEAFKKAQTVKEASEILTNNFFRPLKGHEHFYRRENVANYYYNNPPQEELELLKGF